MCQTKVLTGKGSTVISQCSDCKLIYVWHTNLLLNFTTEELKEFNDFASQLEFKACCQSFPDLVERIILNTPNHDIAFTFTFDEWVIFKEAMNEAVFMLEVYTLIQ